MSKPSLEVLFTPAEFAALPKRDLSNTLCVVFDIFRATSTIVTALANGADSIIPVAEIADGIVIHKSNPSILLAGERDGVRITAAMTGGIEFDLGNSPREFTSEKVAGKSIILSTTNGSRALRACVNAKTVLIGSFLNLKANADYIGQSDASEFLFVCSGTGSHAAYEDILGAGALVELLSQKFSTEQLDDSAIVAKQIYQQNSGNLLAAAHHCKNGRRLLSMPALRDDVAFCLQRDLYPLIAQMEKGAIKKSADL